VVQEVVEWREEREDGGKNGEGDGMNGRSCRTRRAVRSNGSVAICAVRELVP